MTKKRIKDKPFCVIRYNIRAAGEEGKEWGLTTSPSKEDLVVLSKTEAREIIKQYGLVEAMKNEDGVVYDTPDKSFYNQFKDYFKNRWKKKE